MNKPGSIIGIKRRDSRTSNLVLACPMNERSGYLVNNYGSGSISGPGVLQSTGWKRSVGPGWGSKGSGLLWNKTTTNRVLFPAAPWHATLGPLTIACWTDLATTGQNGFGQLVMKFSGTTNYLNFGCLSTNNRMYFGIKYATTALDVQSKTNFITYNTLQHCVVTWDGVANGNGVRMYMNGIESGSYTVTGGVGARTDDSSVGIAIGNKSDAGFDLNIDGYTYDCRIWNCVLTPSEIWRLYTNPWELYTVAPRKSPKIPAAAAGGFFSRYYYDMISTAGGRNV